MELIIVMSVFVAVAGGFGLYMSDPSGWKATGKRLTTVMRAHLEAGKPIKELTKEQDKKALDTWTAEFTEKPLETGPKHEIVKTWFAPVGDAVYPHFKCKCGRVDWHINISAATRISKEHVKNMNTADDLMKKNGGTYAW